MDFRKYLYRLNISNLSKTSVQPPTLQQLNIPTIKHQSLQFDCLAVFVAETVSHLYAYLLGTLRGNG